MSNWIDLFYAGPHQIVPVAVGFVLWIGLAGLGYLVTGRDRVTEANVFFGWAAVSTTFTLVGIFIAGSFQILSILAGILAGVGIVLARLRGDRLFVAGSWRIAILSLPLLLIAGAMDPSQWDEFSHWLPASRFLIASNGFPTADHTFEGFAGYPYAWPFLMYLGGQIAGGFLNNIGYQLNVLMLLTFAVFALRFAFALAGRPRADVVGWPFAAAAALVATAFNPTFVQKIVLTAYSDVSSAVVTGVAVLVGYTLIERLVGRDPRPALGAAWQLALVLALLINIRQTNLSVFLAVAFATALVAWRDTDVRFARFAGLFPIVLIPAILLYALWRYYIATRLVGLNAEASLGPLSQWNFHLIPRILASMAEVAFKKFAFFIPMLIACGFAVRALIRCRDGFDRISLLVGVVFAANLAFLFIIYLGHFGEAQAVTAVSFWRYNIDIGMVCTIFLTAGLIWYWRGRTSFDTYPRWIAPLAIVAVLALPIAFATKLRFDFEPPKPHYIAVAKALAPLAATLGNVYVMDPMGTGEAAVITRYYLDRPGMSWISAFSGPTPEVIARYLDNVKRGDHVLIHSKSAGMDEIFGQTLDERTSYLFKREPGEWLLVRVWAKPADHPF
jgi:hypothetical protein